MAKLLQLPNGNYVVPSMIKGISKVPKKGVIFKNEYNKLIEFIKATDPKTQTVIADTMFALLGQGPDWDQPDWTEILPPVIATAK